MHVIHTREVNTVYLRFAISGASTIALGTLQLGALSLGTLSENPVLFEVVVYSL